MSIHKLASDAVDDIIEAIDNKLDDHEIAAITRIIEEKLVDAVVHSSHRYSEAAATACGAESDLAHKIAREVDLARNALIANLKSMR